MIKPITKFETHLKLSVVLALSVVNACASDTATRPPQAAERMRSRNAPPELVAAMSRVAEEANAVRSAYTGIAKEAGKNGDRWFGTRGQRTHETRCRGVAALMSQAIRDADAATGRSRSEAQRGVVISQVLGSTRCASGASPMSVFPASSGFATATTAASSFDEAEDYVSQNLGDNATSAINAYASYVGGNGATSPEPFAVGLTALEADVFFAAASELDASLATYGGGASGGEGGGADGRDPGAQMLSVFRQYPTWYYYVAGGCAGGVGSGLGDIITGAVAGFRIGGWGGAAVGGAAVAVERCGLGALGGYLTYLALK